MFYRTFDAKSTKSMGRCDSPHPPNAAQVWNASSATNRGNLKPYSLRSLARQISTRFLQAYRHLFARQTLALCLLSADCAICIRGKYFPEPLSVFLLNNNFNYHKTKPRPVQVGVIF